MSREQPVAHSRPCTLHRTHPTTVAFFDETGAIASDRFFTVGLLRVDDHASLLKQVKALRKREKLREVGNATAHRQRVHVRTGFSAC